MEGIKNLLNNSTRFLINLMAAWGGTFLFARLLYIHSLLSKNNNCIKKEEKVLAWLGFAIIIISEKNRLVSRNFGQTDFPTYSLSFYCCPGQNNGEKATIEFFAQWTNGEFAPFYFCKLTRTYQVKPSLATKSRGQIP